VQRAKPGCLLGVGPRTGPLLGGEGRPPRSADRVRPWAQTPPCGRWEGLGQPGAHFSGFGGAALGPPPPRLWLLPRPRRRQLRGICTASFGCAFSSTVSLPSMRQRLCPCGPRGPALAVLSWTLPVGTRCSGHGRRPSGTQAGLSLGQLRRAGQSRDASHFVLHGLVLALCSAL